MCYNIGLSIGSATVLCAFSAWLVFGAGQKFTPQTKAVIAGTLVGLSTMQISEAFMHADSDCSTGLNKFGSRLALMSLYVLQPIFSAAGMAAMPHTSFAGYSDTANHYGRYVWAAWGIMYLVLTCMVADSDLIGDNTFQSTALNQTVSRWCTVDKDNDSLHWRFDDANPAGIWYVYYFVVLGWSALHIEGVYTKLNIPAAWVWFIAIPLVHVCLIYVTSYWTAPASCFFGPLITALGLFLLKPKPHEYGAI